MKNTQKPVGQQGKSADHSDKNAKGQRGEGTARTNQSDATTGGRSAPSHRQDEPNKMRTPERDQK